MKILMVYPEMSESITTFTSMVQLSGRKSSIPPLGLLTVAAMLPKEWDIRLVDVNTDVLRNDAIEWADYVMISAMNVQSHSSREIIRTCVQLKKPTIAGGPLFTHEYLKFPEVTHFVLNEAELTLPPFLEDLRNGTAKAVYSSAEYSNIHHTPLPRWDLIDLNKYMYSILQYSRGCPYLCDFCDVTALFGRVPRVKTGARIIEELDAMPAYAKNEMIFFADDNLIGNKRSLMNDLLPALIEWRKRNPYAPAFATQLTITLADDPQLMELLLEAGFRHILIGIESIDEEALINMRKKQNAGRNILQNIREIQSKGFIVVGTFIVGLDGDRPSVFNDVAQFIQESAIVLTFINILKAPFGTELYERMEREGRLITDLDFGEHRSNIRLKMGEQNVIRGYLRVIDEVYSSAAVYRRSVDYLKNLHPPRVQSPIRRRVTVGDIRQFLVMIYELGVRFPDRKFVWKLLGWTLWNKPNYFVLSLFFSLTMHYYRRLHKIYNAVYSDIDDVQEGKRTVVHNHTLDAVPA